MSLSEIGKLKRKEWELKNAAKLSEYHKKYRSDPKNKAKLVDWKQKNKEQWLEICRKSRRKNYSKIAVVQRVWYKAQLKKSSFRVKEWERTRIKNAIRTSGVKTKERTLKNIGCTSSELKRYLESKFHEGMTWENHSAKGWHVDHIIPISSFDLNNPEDVKKCFHFTNLQPLWAQDNLKKGNTLVARDEAKIREMK